MISNLENLQWRWKRFVISPKSITACCRMFSSSSSFSLFRNQYSKDKSALLFHSGVVQANSIGFKSLILFQRDVKEDEVRKYGRFYMVNKPLDFDKQCLLYTLHVWFMHRRLTEPVIEGTLKTAGEKKNSTLKSAYLSLLHNLKNMGKPERRMQKDLFERLWDLLMRFIKADPDLNFMQYDKSLRETQKLCMEFCLYLDYALQFYSPSLQQSQPKDSQARKLIESAIFHKFFRSDMAVNDLNIGLLAQYILDQLDNLYQNQTVANLLNGDINWVEPPRDSSFIASLEKKFGLLFLDFNNLEWVPTLDKDGKKYFYNVQTRQTTFENKLIDSPSTTGTMHNQ